MYFNRIEDIPHVEERAVIINCGTKEASTLALLSTLRYAEMPVLLVDCESPDNSLEHFLKLMEQNTFDVLSAPLRGHGITLDWIFAAINADKVLLVDSDLEILDAALLRFMHEYIDDSTTFGAGFVQGPTWIDDWPGTILEGAYLQERCWIPFAFLKVSFVREALEAGISFRARTIYNDFFFSTTLSRGLVKLKMRYPILKRFQTPMAFRKTYYGFGPSVVYCDTGANMFQYLRYRREIKFVGLPERFHQRYVTHFGGLTRIALNHHEIEKGKDEWIRKNIRERLRDGYEIVLQD